MKEAAGVGDNALGRQPRGLDRLAPDETQFTHGFVTAEE